MASSLIGRLKNMLTTIPYLNINTGDKLAIDMGYASVYLHPVDLKNILHALIVSPQFLTTIAQHDKPYVREVAASHLNTPQKILSNMLHDSSTNVSWAALENPQTPFKDVLIAWHEKMPEGTLWDSPAVFEREEELLELLAQYNITEEESKKIPAQWLVQIFKS